MSKVLVLALALMVVGCRGVRVLHQEPMASAEQDLEAAWVRFMAAKDEGVVYRLEMVREVERAKARVDWLKAKKRSRETPGYLTEVGEIRAERALKRLNDQRLERRLRQPRRRRLWRTNRRRWNDG